MTYRSDDCELSRLTLSAFGPALFVPLGHRIGKLLQFASVEHESLSPGPYDILAPERFKRDRNRLPYRSYRLGKFLVRDF